MKFEVMYKVVANNLNESEAWRQAPGVASHNTMVVDAPHQSAAEHMVRSMNGGSNHCMIVRAKHIG
jgi:hypothetical protein